MAKTTMVNAWREILARTFAGFAVEYNTNPDWLVNPASGRKLKLDLFYPEIGLAVRFAGLRGSQQRGRLSLDEVAQLKAREAARDEVSAAHGVNLATLDMAKAEPEQIFNELDLAMSRASRRLTKDEARPSAEKTALIDRLRRARSEARRYRRQIHSDKDLALYLDLWRDRQYREADRPVAASAEPTAAQLPVLEEGMVVEHSHFGLGIVEAISAGQSRSEDMITIQFDNQERRTFLAGLLAGKVRVD